MENLPLYKDLLLTVIKARIEMDFASARADILLNIFLITVEDPGAEAFFVERVVNHLELDMLDAREAPQLLRDATVETARVVWAFRKNPTSAKDQNVRDALQRWERAYQQAMGENPVEAFMDIENARCLDDPEYYSTPPMPFASRARIATGTQN